MSRHNLSNYDIFAGQYGKIYPCGLYEVLPTDYIRHQSQMLVRVAPMNAPVMHPTRAFVRHFEVPMRLLWDEWEEFITGKSTTYTFPTLTVAADAATTQPLLDYLGIDISATGLEISALPVRAFNLIINRHFLDQDLQTERDLDDCSIPNVAWEKDPFTSARPFSQQGPAVTLPLSGDFDVKLKNTSTLQVYKSNQNGAEDQTVPGSNFSLGSGNLFNNTGAFDRYNMNPNGTLHVDPAGLNIDVLDLRKSMALQRFAEARAMYGSRYVEYLRYIGVKGELDARLQEPQYLGGGSKTMAYSEVLATAEAGNAKVGDLYGHGINALRSNSFRRYFQDFGYVLSLFYIRPKTIYMNATDRHWLKRTKEEFFQRELQAIGSQEIYNAEVKAGHATPQGIFGYQNRYYDYQRVQSKVAGSLRNIGEYWHQGRNFGGTDPALNETFIKCDPSVKIFQDQTAGADQYTCMMAHSIRARRPVKKVNIGSIR